VFKTKKIQLLFYVYKTGRCDQFRKASKTKKRDNLSIASRFVPLTLPTSNSFYENVEELYALKETLKQQGILSNDGNGLALARD